MSAVEKLPTIVENTSAPLTPMDMLNTALTRGADISVLEKLMGLQERWEANQARKAFDAALADAKASINPIKRNATGHNNKRYADFAAIAREVDPVLASHGLSYRFRTQQTDRIHVTCILSHKDGHSEETTLAGPADSSGSKNAIQAIGSTLSYLQRYSLVQALGLAIGDDDDGHAAGASDGEITIPQIEDLQALIVKTGTDINKFLDFLKATSLDDLTAKEAERSIGMLKRKLVAQRGK